MELESMITNLGFPIAVTVYLFFERRTTMQKLTDVILDNTRATDSLRAMIEKKSP